jgi:hypothetical protein
MMQIYADWLVVMDDLRGLELRIQRWEQENSEPDVPEAAAKMQQSKPKVSPVAPSNAVARYTYKRRRG